MHDCGWWQNTAFEYTKAKPGTSRPFSHYRQQDDALGSMKTSPGAEQWCERGPATMIRPRIDGGSECHLGLPRDSIGV